MLETLRELLDRDPFEPFRIMLTSGHAYEVSNPHLVALGQTQLTLYSPRSDKYAVLRLNQIAAFESIDKAA
jgi:hypothetical protein